MSTKLNKKSKWKLETVTKYLKGEAIKIYIKDWLNSAKYYQIAELLKEKIVNITIPRFSAFTNLKLGNMSEL